MSNNHHESPLKPWLNIYFLFNTKITYMFTAFIKAFFAICLVACLSLLTYSSLSNSQATIWDDTPSHLKDFLNISNQTAAEVGKKNVIISSVSSVGINKSTKVRTDLSHIVFGISGTAKTWENRRYYVESWWMPNVTRGFVWLDEFPSMWPETTSPPYRVSADTERFRYTCDYGSRAAIRIARIVKETFELGLENVRWFVMGDDDTVFFLENLVTVLDKYDDKQMYYIGGNSESIEQDMTHSYRMAYGGGGFAISYPLAAVLIRVLDGCINRYASFYGSDEKIGGCMSEIGVPLTKELGFHQVDIQRNPYGLLAAHPVAPLVSLHHLDYLDPIFPGLTQKDSIKKLVNAHKLDPGRTIQQTFCYDLARNWSLSISWGYTVQIYLFLVTTKDMETPFRTFQTWRTWSDGPFAFNTRDLSTDPCQRPVIFFLDLIEETEPGRAMSFYRRSLGNNMVKDCEDPKFFPVLSLDEVRVSAATFELDTWKKAPRRQCCEIVDDPEDRSNNTISVNVRGCQDFESVTPP